jgi:hypothetical protein
LVVEPGDYGFLLTSDDGAKLYIDDQLIIDNDGLHTAQTFGRKVGLTAGRHTIRVAYFQGLPTNVALVLRVKAPKQKWTVFDMRQFARPLL